MLADSVRDYSIFLLDANGLITFWGEGARALEGWTQDEAEGAHLRLLYPEGGRDAETAEDHLRKARAAGQFSGEASSSPATAPMKTPTRPNATV
jgi:PAS domain-containing protein